MTDYNNPNGYTPPEQQPPDNSTVPPQDPYRTTGGNMPPNNWQQGQYTQYNPRTGWADNHGGAPHAQNSPPPQGQPTQGPNYTWSFSDYEATDKTAKKGKKKHRGLIVFTGIVCSLFAVTLIGFAGFGVWQLVSGIRTEPKATAPVASETLPTTPELTLRDVPQEEKVIAADGKLTPTQVASKVRPSVVGIVAYVPTNSGSYYDFGNTLAQSEGSGIVMSADGYIITNAHVVAGSNGIKVVLNNDEEYTAELIGADSSTDLAVLKINADNLTPAEFGDSSSLEVGQYVAAIGNPGGLTLSNSMTQGIVSGINRALNIGDGFNMNYIQTDAAINPGNSGGALVNEYGQVVGINSVKIAQTEYEGLGFAIPVSAAKPIIDDLIAHGKVTGRVRLGIEGREIDEITARYNSIPMGFQVLRIDTDADIATRGIVAGDIITKMDDKDIAGLGDMREALRGFKPGDQIKLTIFRRTSGRQDSTFEVSVALMEDLGDTAQEAPQATQQ